MNNDNSSVFGGFSDARTSLWLVDQDAHWFTGDQDDDSVLIKDRSRLSINTWPRIIFVYIIWIFSQAFLVPNIQNPHSSYHTNTRQFQVMAQTLA